MCSELAPDRTRVDSALVESTRGSSGELGSAIVDALDRFRSEPPADGAVVIRGLDVGDLPDTPAGPTVPFEKDLVSETTLLRAAGRLGQAVGYLPEHGGDLVQNLVPTVEGADRQTSTSSRVDLEFHTETAFHPFLPRYLLLLCLRGDPLALTTLCAVAAVLPHLRPDEVEVLREPRFRCGVDESFTNGRTVEARPPAPVLWGDPVAPCWTFDADLMEGTDAAARAALARVRRLVAARHGGVVLESGDLLVVDNARVVHGRSAYTPRFDGTDRWLQRAFVVTDLGPSASDRSGRVISTVF